MAGELRGTLFSERQTVMRSPGVDSRVATTAMPPSSVARTSTGIRGLDERLEGGFPKNRAIVVCGEPGTGKSTMALQFLAAGLLEGERGICVSVDQKPRHLVEDAARFGWQLEGRVSNGDLTLLDASPYFTKVRNKSKSRFPVDGHQIATDLSQQVSRSSARRLVIDSLTSLVPLELSRAETQDYLRSIVLSLEDNLNCTVLLTCRSVSDDPLGISEAAQFLSSGVIELRMRQVDSSCGRYLFVKKMRGTNAPPQEHSFVMTPGTGIELTRS